MIVQTCVAKEHLTYTFLKTRGECLAVVVVVVVVVVAGGKKGGGTVLVLFLLLLLLLLEPKTAKLVNLLVQPIPQSPKPLYHSEVALNKNHHSPTKWKYTVFESNLLNRPTNSITIVWCKGSSEPLHPLWTTGSWRAQPTKKNKAEISVAKSDLVFKLLTNIWNTLRPISTWCSTSAVRRDVIVIINIIVDTL